MVIHHLFGDKSGKKGAKGPGNSSDSAPYDEDVSVEDQDQVREQEQLFQQAAQVRGSVLIRLLFFIGMYITLIAALLMGILFILFLALTTVTFYQVPTIREVMSRYWNDFKRWTALCTGCAIGIFSPSLGFGFVLMYFFMNDQLDENSSAVMRNIYVKMGEFMESHHKE